MANFSLRILIVEDDPLFGVELEMLVKETGYQVIDVVDNSSGALEAIFTESPDLILMDVDIKGKMTGLDIGQQIKHLAIPILYITSYDDQASYARAEATHLIGYLVKPLSKYTLKSSISLAIKSLQSTAMAVAETAAHEDDTASAIKFFSKDSLFFKQKNVFQKIKVNDIHYLEADGDYVLTYLDENEKFISRCSLSQMEELLPADTFMRIHRSFIVNLKRIQSIDFQEAALVMAGRTLPMNKQKGLQLKESIRKVS